MVNDAEWSGRIGRHLRPDGSVVIPPRIAKLLDDRANMLSEQRIMLRAADAEAYEVLSALRLSALGHEQNVFRATQQPTGVSASGHKNANDKSFQQQSNRWLTTTQAAQLTGVHDRTIRRWIVTQRLPANRHGGRWLIDRQHLAITKALTA